MRHVTVRRAALLLGGVFLACAVIFAWLVSREPAPSPASETAAAPAGAVLFQTYCASCHTVESLHPYVTRPGVERNELEAFLLDHGDASAEDDRLILDYVSGGASGR